jgi:hypothetical protein
MSLSSSHMVGKLNIMFRAILFAGIGAGTLYRVIVRGKPNAAKLTIELLIDVFASPRVVRMRDRRCFRTG